MATYVELLSLLESIVENEIDKLDEVGALAALTEQDASKLKAQMKLSSTMNKLHERAQGDWSKARKSYAKKVMHSSLNEAYECLPGASPSHGGAGTKDPRVQAYLRTRVETLIERFDKLAAQCGKRVE